MKYCSVCGTPNPVFEIPEGDTRPRYVCKNCHTIHYTNPNIVAGCLPLWEGQVLLCRRAIPPRVGYWNVPSGYLENGETVEEGAIREVWEEAEAKVKIIGAHSIYSLPQINQIYIHFLAELIDGKFGIGPESTECKLFREEDIPWDEMAFTSSTFSLQKFFADRKNDGLHKTHLGAYIHPHKKEPLK
ncbi:MAG: NUDIX hydrolase [Bacteroidota bacterium]